MRVLDWSEAAPTIEVPPAIKELRMADAHGNRAFGVDADPQRWTGARLVLHSCSDEGQSATVSMVNRMAGSVIMSRLLRCIPNTSVACSTGSSATGQSNRDVMRIARFWMANVVLYSLYSFVPKPTFSFNGCRQLGPQRVTSALTRTEWGRACVQARRTLHRQRKAAPSRYISVQRCQSCRCG